MTSKPLGMIDIHLEFLDKLHEAGTVNMFGAVPDFASFFGLEQDQSKQIIAYWLRTRGSLVGLATATV